MIDKETIANKITNIKNFKDLRIWQEGIKLVKYIYLFINQRLSKRRDIRTKLPDDACCCINSLKHLKVFRVTINNINNSCI